ncbi:D-Ala-D-Ala carboxypeptidase family metallohydrolase [Cyclobacterium marinum]|uniref:Peptidase M15A n=1 Tax=Cyclobacterium marinum (strain ATCC 25205 / DSM 745 / LMG 13164 / NCIMB 1802) TaxID=880070 RepID=G0IZ71_CYCMS|nr:D-Ala-D-Ala carboxypeptidase family metallohydrolase [Cyclobacterium marinum]AEL23850.1 Peptidase M15A [Cyclobacterium marinum DSM 745]
MSLQYFNLSEFDSPDEPGSGERMQESTLAMLEKARHQAGIPFAINSGVRTPSHNEKVGGISNSAHLSGWAADIATSKYTQKTIVMACQMAGFQRIGIYKNFIHVDNDPTKPSPAQWKG